MLKSITLTTTDYPTLQAHLARALNANPKNRDVWKRLHDELDRAVLLPGELISRDVVRVGSTFTVRDLDSDELDTFTLVWPEQSDVDRGRISVLTPLGTAVIGFAQGDEIDWEMPRGLRRLRLETVNPGPAAS